MSTAPGSQGYFVLLAYLDVLGEFVLYSSFLSSDSCVVLSLTAGPKLDFDNRYLGTLEVKRGATLMLPINIRAVPRPRVAWYRDGIPLHNMPGKLHPYNVKLREPAWFRFGKGVFIEK